MQRGCSRCEPLGGSRPTPSADDDPRDGEIIEMLDRRWRRCPECQRVREIDARPSTGPWAVEVDPVTPLVISTVPYAPALDAADEVTQEIDDGDLLPPLSDADATPEGGIRIRSVVDDDEKTLPDPTFSRARLQLLLPEGIDLPSPSRLGKLVGLAVLGAALFAAVVTPMPPAMRSGARQLTAMGTPDASGSRAVSAVFRVPTSITHLTGATLTPTVSREAPPLELAPVEPAPARPAPSRARRAAAPPPPIACEVATRQAARLFAHAEFADARGAYAHALALNPDFIPARLGLADSTWAVGDRLRARALYRALQQDHPGGRLPARVDERAAPVPIFGARR